MSSAADGVGYVLQTKTEDENISFKMVSAARCQATGGRVLLVIK